MSDQILNRDDEFASSELPQEPLGIQKTKRKLNTKITDRDLDILEFLLEMKFANLRQLHMKFFKTREDGKQSQSELWAQERLRALRKLGLLSLKPVFLNESYFFLATAFGQECLQNSRPHRTFVRALDAIDHRTFIHDRLVVETRLRLEHLARAQDWMPERRLKSESSLQFGLAREYQPDAIYRNKSGELIAFELENTSKTKARYEDKIRKYVSTVKHQRLGQPSLAGVLFVVVNEGNFQTLTALTSPYPGQFKIERYSDLVPNEFGNPLARMNSKSTNQKGEK